MNNRPFAGRAVCALGPSAPSLYKVEPTSGQSMQQRFFTVRKEKPAGSPHASVSDESSPAITAIDLVLMKKLNEIYGEKEIIHINDDTWIGNFNKLEYQSIMKKYVTAIAAVEDFENNAQYDKDSRNSVRWFLFASLALSFFFVGISCFS